jgi:hypothetical protein
MPKRVVDGDAVWRSKKLKLVSPPFRAEYANLVPLAEANGVFELDVDRVWSDVYSYNREDVSVETVQVILAELEKVGLLRVWEEAGKTWGYWEGIHKSGRLPKASELQKYKHLPPDPPIQTSLSGDSAEGALILAPRFGIGLVLDRSGLEDENEELLGETDMKSEKQITTLCKQIFGRSVHLHNGHKDELKRLDASYKGSAVVRAFEEWGTEHAEDDLANPVAVFLTLADDLLGVETTSQAAAKSPEVVNLVREIVYLSDGKVTFDDRQKPALSELLASYSQTEILGALREWLPDQDFSIPKNVQYSGKNFTDRADGLCYGARRKKLEKSAEESAREAAKQKLQSEAEVERTQAEAAKNSEEELFDPLAEVV